MGRHTSIQTIGKITSSNSWQAIDGLVGLIEHPIREFIESTLNTLACRRLPEPTAYGGACQREFPAHKVH